MNRWINEIRKSGAGVNALMEEQYDRWIERWTDRQTDRQSAKLVGRWIDGRTVQFKHDNHSLKISGLSRLSGRIIQTRCLLGFGVNPGVSG